MAKWAIYSTVSCSCHGSEKMLVNAVVKMQWVAPHSLARPDSHVQRRVWPIAYLAAMNIEALQMHFKFRNNNPPACITA